jgi:aldehyde oxidoreductase
VKHAVPKEADRIAFELNGEPVVLAETPFTSLADAVRNNGETGTKIGCDAGDCGACTVLLDGEPVCACLVPLAQAKGRRVTTIEALTPTSAGLYPDGLLEQLAAAFTRHGAAQCGICTPGMMMAARALISRQATPARAEAEDAIGGVLCRCTGYTKIIDAICDTGNNLWTGMKMGGVGARLQRADGRHQARGDTEFGADFAPEGALWLRVIRAPYASATFSFGDLDAFRQRHGLDAVLTARDVPGRNSFGIFPNTKDQPVFAERHVRYRGEAVAALVGRRDIIEAINGAAFPITWSETSGLHGVGAALAPQARAIHDTHMDNVLTRGILKRGDVAAGHASAAATAEGAFETSFVEHAYIEPEAGYALRDGDTVTIAASTQAPYMDREETAAVLGIPEENVIIAPTACGGGFGGKLDISVQPFLAIAAWTLNRPVRMIYSRIESMASTTKRHPSTMRAKASADAQGRLTAYEMTGDFNTGAYASWGPTVANRVPIHAHGPYKVPNVWNRTRAIYTNDTPAGAFRGFGVPQSAIANETLMDDLAEKLCIDRWQIRHINALRAGDATASGQVLHASAGLAQCLDALKPAWDKAQEEAAVHNATNARHKRGTGIACMWYGCGNTALPNPSEMRITLARTPEQAGVAFVVHSGAVDIGQGVSTVILQIVREALAIDGAHIHLTADAGNTALTLDAGKTSASRQTFVSGNAARLAALDLRAKLERLANVAPGAPMRMSAGDDFLVVGSADERRLKIDAPLEGHGRYDPPTTALDADGQGTPYATYGFAAQIAEVMVDTALGTTKVLHIHAAHDVGRAINPMLVEGQIHGGIAQGLGLALMEEFIPGKTENLHDYLIPTAGDMPPVTIHIIEDPEPEGPFGAKGVGEPALVATAPAILGAIRHATGVTMRRVPVLPHRLWAALNERDVT